MRNRICLFLLLVVIAFALVGKAAGKPLWFDEILTLTIARLPVGTEMWEAMTAGFEFNPPLLYLATHAAMQLFGESHLAARLPQIVAGIGGLLLGFAVASRRNSPIAGFWFILLICGTQLYSYFYEARPYAMVFFATMLAWFLWQKIAAKPQPGIAYLAALTASLTMALLSHFWAIVVLPCFFASALALSYERKRLLWKELGAICLALPALAICIPMIRATRGVVFGGSIYIPSLWQATIGFYLDNFGFFLLVFFFVLFLFMLLSSMGSARTGTPWNLSIPGLPFHEVVLAVSLVLSPLLIYLITKATHSAFMGRYTLVACTGAAFLGAHICSAFSSHYRMISGCILVAMSLFYVGQVAKEIKRGWSYGAVQLDDLSLLKTPPYADLPIVHAQPVLFTESDFYAPPELASRFVYIVDRRMAIELAQTDGVDAALIIGSKWLRLKGRIIPYQDFTSSYKKFVLLHDDNPKFNWISQKLRLAGARMTVLPTAGQRMLLCELF